MTRFLQIAAGLAFAAAGTLPAYAADPTDVIDYRKHVMKTLGEQAAAMAMTLQGKAPAENFSLHVQALANAASQALVAFEPKVEGGESKPDVWKNWADFSKRMKELETNTAELAKLAASGGPAAVGPKLQSALTCKGCHDTYREQKK